MAGIISEIEVVVDDHMYRQPFETTCSTCGEILAVNKEINGDKDLILFVDPCEQCLGNEYERGVTKGR